MADDKDKDKPKDEQPDKRRKPKKVKPTRDEVYFDQTWRDVELEELNLAHRRLTDAL